MRTLTLPEARALLRSRAQLVDAGLSERDLRSFVAAGTLRRVRRGWYVYEDDWRDLWPEGKHLVEVEAAHRNAEPPGPIFMGVSAAVLHGLPLFRTAPESVHTIIEGARHSRARTGTHWHDTRFSRTDVTVIGGIRCTTLNRTVVDISSTMSMEAAVAAADAALRSVAVGKGHVQDADVAAQWRNELGRQAEARSTRGIRQARRVIAFADGRAQLPGESVSRLQLHRLGFSAVELQTRVIGPDGEEYWLDFGFPHSRSFGEFDGMTKYRDPAMRSGRSMEEVVLDEKRREDAVRGVTGWRIVRWESAHIATPHLLGARLAAFGIRPP